MARELQNGREINQQALIPAKSRGRARDGDVSSENAYEKSERDETERNVRSLARDSHASFLAKKNPRITQVHFLRFLVFLCGGCDFPRDFPYAYRFRLSGEHGKLLSVATDSRAERARPHRRGFKENRVPHMYVR